MENFKIEASERSPEIDFNFSENQFLIKGESYPEDVTAFFGPVVEKLETHLGTVGKESVIFTFELIYFNSSTAKILMSLFDMLDEKADEGADVLIEWLYEEDDDNMQELGEEYGEDLENAKFSLNEVKID